jgi:3-oxoacyl-[acyl-carrier protein] reductase
MAAGAGRLTGKVALITGGAGGIGRATAEVMAAEGAAIAAADLRGADATVEAVRATGGRALAVAVDVTSPASVEAAVARTLAEFGRLDILVNNAGIDQRGLLEDISEDDWDRMLAVNLKGPFLCTRAAARHLEGGGAVVNTASLAGRSASPIQGCHYSASKAGLLGLTRHLARELGPRGIRVNAVCPGPVMTDMLTRSATPDHIRQLEAAIPLGRPGTAEDIARVITFLASDDAAFVTGAYLDANGGIFMA